MNTTAKPLRFPLAAVFFLISSAFRLIDTIFKFKLMVNQSTFVGFHPYYLLQFFSSLLLFIGFTTLTMLLFLKKRGVLAAVVCAALALPHILLAIASLSLLYLGFVEVLEVLFCFLEAALWVGFGALFLKEEERFAWLEGKTAFLRYLPIVYSVLIAFQCYRHYRPWYLLLCYALLLAAVWLLHLWLRNPYKREEENEEEKEGDETLSEEECLQTRMRRYSISIAKHVLLLLFVPRVWLYIWIHKTTRFLNFTPNEEKRGPGACLLLCIFVPFYQLYWTYKSAQRIDKLGEERGIHTSFASTALLLGIFLPLVANILMQDKINTVIRTPICVKDEARPAPEGVEELLKWKKLLDEGAITAEEYEKKKQQFLSFS